MQNYKNLAKKLFTSQNKNFADFAQTTNELTFVNQLQPKTYYETYKDLYFGAIFFSVLAQIATAISSYSFFVDLFAPKITNEYALIVCVCVVLAIIEIMKFITLNKALLGLFSLPAKPNYVLLSFALVLSICSIYASVIGGGNFGIDNVKVETVKSEHDKEIATLRAEILDIQKRNTYKGNTYIVGKEKKLLHAKETTLQALQAKKDNELNKVHTTNETNANTFKIGFALFDILFLLCSLHVWNFKKLVSIESLANELPAADGTKVAIENINVIGGDVPNTQINAIPNQQNKIGFQYDFTHLKNKAGNELPNEKPNEIKSNNVRQNELPNENKGIDSNTVNVNSECNTVNVNSERIIITLQANEKLCLHCQTVFTYKHWNAKYCSENCRIASWELKTGRKFNKPKTK